jgi:DNA-binding response OmpR family regulator
MKKILLIEDDPDTSDIMRFLLQRLGFAVDFSYNLIPISDVLKIRPDLIILDHRLSNGFGGAFCESLKNTRSTQTIPILMLSASDDIEKIAKGCGANFHLAKPFDVSKFENAVQLLLV